MRATRRRAAEATTACGSCSASQRACSRSPPARSRSASSSNLRRRTCRSAPSWCAGERARGHDGSRAGSSLIGWSRMSSSSQSTARSAGPRSVSAELSNTTSEARAPSRLAHPEQFGRYRLCFELASGGMATVYLAHAGGPGRFQKYVALKRIHAHLASRRDFVEMFHDEATIAARISHPNVAAVFDFGEENGVHYIAMEYLVGEPLIRLLRACRKQPSIDWRAH